jgi:hypothetical protein
MPEEAVTELPLTIDEIDTGWLTAALAGSFPGIRVDDFEILSVRHGFTTVIRVRLDVDDVSRSNGVPETVVVKGGFEPWSRDRARTYAMEAIAYRDVWPVLPLNVPKAYFADLDSERKQAIMIMEDLVPRGVTFCSGLEPRGYEQVARTLSALAAFHAQTWNSPEIGPGGRWDTSSRFEPDGRWVGISNNGAAIFRDYLYHGGFFRPEVFARLARLPRGTATAREFHDLEWAKLAMNYISSLGDILPNCIVHGDMHLGNLYEEPDGTPGFFDALPHKEPAHMEVAYHVTCALDPADRRRWDRALVGHYLDELSRHGVEGPSLDEMMFHFGAYLVYGFYVFFVNDTNWQTESFNTAHAARFSAAMLDHDTKNLIAAASREPVMANQLEAQPRLEVGEPSSALAWLFDEVLDADPHLR